MNENPFRSTVQAPPSWTGAALCVRFKISNKRLLFMPASGLSQTRRASGGGPLYAAITRALRDEIAAGRWAPGDALPTIDALMAQYDVGRVTIRYALKGLAEEGLIVSQRGRGTFVVERPQYRAITHDLFTPPPNLHVEMIEHQTGASLPRAQLIAETTPDAPTHGFERVKKQHSHAGEPVSIVEIYFRPDLANGRATAAEALTHTTVFELIYPALRARDVRLRQTLRVGAAGLETSERLGCEIGAPVIQMQRLIYLSDRSTVYYFGYFEYDAGKYVMDIDGQFDDLRAIATGTALSVGP